MTKIILPLSILASLILRILLPYQTILGGAFVKFADPDSYLYANNVRILAETGKADSLYTIMLYDFSKLFGSEVGMMVLPLLLNVVTLFTIYVICRLLWGKTQALIASAIFAILPGEYLGRSLFGTIDHHVFEVTLTTLAILFVLLAIDAKKWMRVWYIAIAIIPITLYAFVWSGYWLFAAILAIFGVLLLLKKVNKPIITGLVIVMGVVGVAGIMRNALDFSTLSWQTTGETQPIFAGLSIVALLPYALTVIGSFYCWKDYKETKDNKILLLIVWNIIMLLATTFQRRFGYYLAVNGSLMFGYLVYKSALSIDTQKVKLVSLAITGSLCIALVPLSVSIARNVYYAPSDDWMDAAQYIR
ncbi:glycosyltransferase family 39 protein, partial [Patescibacteria group bacterium]|nr:glycosyltransferase family 39 protein [Patescibacteria group bacterium]